MKTNKEFCIIEKAKIHGNPRKIIEKAGNEDREAEQKTEMENMDIRSRRLPEQRASDVPERIRYCGNSGGRTGAGKNSRFLFLDGNGGALFVCMPAYLALYISSVPRISKQVDPGRDFYASFRVDVL